MAKKKPKKWTADEVRKCIENRFDILGNGNSKKSVVFHEVPTGTGFRVGWIDSVVCELWPSNFWHRRAIEIKVARSDFLHELDNYAKSEWAREHFHEFYFCSPPDIIKPDEVPEGCGLYHTRGDSIVTKKKAMRHIPKTTDELVAALMRSAEKAMSSAYERAERKALEESMEYQRMKRVYEIVEEFFNKRGQYICVNDPEEIHERLQKATASDVAKAEFDIVHGQLDTFRNRMFEVLRVMIPMAFIALNETDDLGKTYFRSFGLRDLGAWSEITDRAKASRRRDKTKKAVAVKEIVELLKDPLPEGQTT